MPETTTQNPYVVYFSGGTEQTASYENQYEIFVGKIEDPLFDWGLRWQVVADDDYETVTIGSIHVQNLNADHALSLFNRVYVAADQRLYFSAIGDPMAWGLHDTGAGWLTATNWYGHAQKITAVAPYNGRLAIFASNTIWIFNVAADPLQFSVHQILPNIGTTSGNTVAAYGEADVFFLHHSGVRSLRTRELTGNATVVDIGSPIDSLLQGLAASGYVYTACSVIEPVTNRYWLFIKDSIYVLSYFPQLKIAAWSVWDPVDSTGNRFTPVKFVALRDLVYVLTEDNRVLRYGPEYDNTEAVVETPWLSDKNVATRKTGKGMHAVIEGVWTLEVSMEYETSPTVWQQTYVADETTFAEGILRFSAVGTHFKLRARTTHNGPAKLSAITFHYDLGDDLP